MVQLCQRGRGKGMIRKYFYLIFSLFILISCWEQTRTNAAIASASIPQEAIRLRILANSDRVEDQWLKRKIRDEIVQYMEGWVHQPATIEDARRMIEQRLPQFQQLIEQTLQQYGYTYGYDITLGVVSFPAKMYGNAVYPAGEYEALRVTLGEGKGQNWWCVLFPPLCFIDVVSGEAVPKDTMTSQDEPEESQHDDLSTSQALQAQPELRFFLWDVLQSILQYMTRLFA